MSRQQTASPNVAQVDYWNAAAGTTWARFHDLLDRQIAPLGAEALRVLAAAAGEQVLDVGCGCGQTTLDLAARVGPTGGVVGVDVSAPMLDIARARPVPRGAGAVEFRAADVQVAALGHGRFDAAFSRFGVMFFDDPVAAFSNIRAALRSGGRLAFVCWQPLAVNPWMNEPLAAARPFLPPLAPPEPDAPGPFAFADPERVRSILGSAGFVDLELRAYEASIGGGDIDQMVELTLRIGPLGAALRDNPSFVEVLAAPVRAVLARHVTGGRVLLAASVWIATARNPGPA
jgi:SAM-dependent methyltransferase